MICPVCSQEAREFTLSGRQVMHTHFRKGSAPPCPGSNRTREEAERAAAAEKRDPAPWPLFD